MEGPVGWLYRVAMLNGFQVVEANENLDGIAQFDGAYVDVDHDEARLWIVEAKGKSGRVPELRAAWAATEQLTDRLRERLKWRWAVPPTPIGMGAKAAITLVGECGR